MWAVVNDKDMSWHCTVSILLQGLVESGPPSRGAILNVLCILLQDLKASGPR